MPRVIAREPACQTGVIVCRKREPGNIGMIVKIDDGHRWSDGKTRILVFFEQGAPVLCQTNCLWDFDSVVSAAAAKAQKLATQGSTARQIEAQNRLIARYAAHRAAAAAELNGQQASLKADFDARHGRSS